MSEFHFLRPYWLLSLLPLMALLIYLWHLNRTTHGWETVCDSHLLSHQLVVNKVTTQQRLWLYLLAAGWLLTIFSLAGPSWSQLAQPVYHSHYPRIIVLDLSPAMNAQDIVPSRLERARYKIMDILQRQREGQTGLVVFSAEPHLVSPLTQDAATIAAMVPELTTEIMPVSGSNMAAGLKKAGELLDQAGETKGDIILLTASSPTAEDKDAAKALHQQGKRLMVLGVATKQGAPVPTQQGFMSNPQGQLIMSQLDQKGLEALARDGGGDYVTFSDNNRDIDSLLLNPILTEQDKEQVTETKALIWQDNGWVFILLILVIAMFAFRRGWFERI